ncbi:keratinocyte differentiation factor 1 [Astyanax mexicanus]|uniref:Keratinocyte differentiation factor 1-like n=2 Tax=Astyanax mexicanus TaxID=7994 RepID=A0A8B9RD64_ASTMX|nr:keratinocyte differentiation factor 1 [Astyanax mexicanus]KAG9279298.1 keratinocyte differentiation factor 1-like [Astyanax mexicanus]
MSGTGRGSERWENLSMRSSSINSRPYQERCVDPVDPEIHLPVAFKKTYHKDANGNATMPEAAVFLSEKAEPASGASTCSPCASMSSCRTFMCSVLTCGLYRVCRQMPCLLPAENSGDIAEPVTATPDKNGFYSDLRIGGIKVDTSVIEEGQEQVSFSPSKSDLDSPTYPSGSMDFSTLLDEGLDEDVDSLITRKLLEVFSEFEINELAKCTSDSMFLKRSQEISQLISDIVQEHNIKEQEAECRLVREIIRISTRKSKKKLPFRPQEPQRDSGNDTWRSSRKSNKKSSFNSVSDGSLKISVERSDDIEARKLRNNSNQSYSPSSPVPYSPSFLGSLSPVTSNTPLLTHSVRA